MTNLFSNMIQVGIKTSPLQAILLFVNQAIAKFFQPKWESYLYVILPHPTEAKILMLSERGSYFLPYVRVNKSIDYANFITIKSEIEPELGFSVNILYYASQDYDKSKRQICYIYVLERDASVAKFKEGDWIDLEILRNQSLKSPEHKSVIETYLTEIESGDIPELRPPWARVGWLKSAVQWIDEQLLKLNYHRLSPVECIRSCGISCVLRVKTSVGNIYLKESSKLPLFCNEPVVTAELANLFPAHIPNVLSVDTQRHWMLLADFGEPIDRNTPIKLQKDIYRLLAQIQIKSVQHIDNLLSVGCLDRRLNWLATQIDVLFNDEIALSRLQADEIKQLQTFAPYLENLCSQLTSYQIPQTLIHSDLHLGNVALYKDSYLLFDWTDSCISHPFFDMFELFFPRQDKPFSSALKDLQEEYLAQWTAYEPMSRLLEAWTLSKPLCALHHAVSYQHIVACLEPRAKQELSNALPHFLRELLKCTIELVEK
ncbi:phosphotransferase [Nostoc sp.]